MRRLIGILALGTVCFWGFGQMRAAGEEKWARFDKDIEMRTVKRRSGFSTVTVTALRVPYSKISVASGALLNSAQWRQRLKARAVINGGYFDGANRSLGLRVGDAKRTSNLRQADWGVFYIRDGRARIVHTRDYQPSTRTKQALQCGPRLVVNGRVTDLKPQWARRSGIGIDRSGKVVLAVSDGELSFDDWAKIWAQNLDCPNALNLDGGGSTQLSARSGKNAVNVQGYWPVPDVVAIR